MGWFGLLVVFALVTSQVRAKTPCLLRRHFSDKDPEVFLNVTQIVRRRGFQAEDHDVVTSDGYILNVDRILPKGEPNGRVALLQHGLLDSAHTWVNNANEQSLGFILAQEGYDVWMPNSRGNTYSQRHIYLKPTEKSFWDFSWDEMASHDLPACINYILKKTNQSKLYYIGHSQGTEIFFAHMSSQVAAQSRIAAMVALAPVAYLDHLESPVGKLASICQNVGGAVNWLGRGKFLPANSMLKFVTLSLCRETKSPDLCSNFVYMLAGKDANNTDNARMAVYMAHMPAGTSVRNVIHYCQSVTSAKFQKFDFGRQANLRHYGQATPPQYSLSTVKVPTAMFWGGNDWLASPLDVHHTREELGDAVAFDKFLPDYNHLDFVWGANAAERVYRPMLDFMRAH